MKTNDLLKYGIIAGIGIFVLPKILNTVKGITTGTDESGFLTGGGVADVIGSGGQVTTKKESGLPWYTFISPFTILTGYMQDLSGSGDVTQQSKPNDTKSKAGIKVKSSYSPTVKGYTDLPIKRAVGKIKRSSGVTSSSGTPKQKAMLSTVTKHLQDTKTKTPGVISGMTQARISSRLKYGGWGGR